MIARLPIETSMFWLLMKWVRISSVQVYIPSLLAISGYGQKEPDTPDICRIVVLGLTEETKGNAIGVGLADYITERLRSSIDLKATNVNGFTAFAPEKVKIPMTLANDRDAISAALLTSGASLEPEQARLIRVKNTQAVEEMDISEALIEEAKAKGLEIVGGLREMQFDEDGRIYSF